MRGESRRRGETPSPRASCSGWRGRECGSRGEPAAAGCGEGATGADRGPRGDDKAASSDGDGNAREGWSGLAERGSVGGRRRAGGGEGRSAAAGRSRREQRRPTPPVDGRGVLAGGGGRRERVGGRCAETTRRGVGEASVSSGGRALVVCAPRGCESCALFTLRWCWTSCTERSLRPVRDS